MKPIDKLTKARAGLVLDSPFFGTLAIRLQLIENGTDAQYPETPTASTNGKVIVYNPDFIDTLNLDKCKGLLVHEILHVALNHTTRRKNRNHKYWNIAGDYAINPLIQEAGFYLPNDVLMNNEYKGKSTDEIYSKVFRPEPEEQQAGKGKGQQGKGKGPQQGPPGPEDFGQVFDYQGTEAEKTQMENEWKIALQQATALSAGRLSGGLKELVKDVVNPELDWKKLLEIFLQQTARNDYSMSRPNRRYIGYDLYLPSIHSMEIGKLVVAVDCSGSIDYKALTLFNAELNSILETYQGIELDVHYFDTKIHRTETYTNADAPIKMTAHGRGGTDFRPVFDHVDKSGETPQALLIFTDLEGPYPKTEPAYPVLWLCTSRHSATIGQTIHF